jgi:S-adenosylmethionine hydrolase
MGANHARGEVVFVDSFGNLISNVPGSALPPAEGAPIRARVGDAVASRRVRTYADGEPGELVALVSSSGLLEVAVVQGSAAHLLSQGAGAPVTVEW